MNSILRRLVLCLGLAFLVFSPHGAMAKSVPPSERIVILVSLDAFRWDYVGKFPTPNLKKIASEGVQAKKMIPMFPSMTFPNHHTIVTGWRPAHHGVIHNNFYDPATKGTFAFNKTEQQGPEWWGGEPIWATAIKQGRKANVLYWPGTGIEMAGLLPTEWKRYESKPEPNEIVDTGLAWLEQPDKRPSFVMLYFHQVDSVGHKTGTDSPEIAAAVAQVDEAMGRLVEGIHRLKLDDVANLIIVSDHGMANISPDRTIALGDYVDLKKVQVDFSGAIAGLRPLEGTDANAIYHALKEKEKDHHYKVYNQDNMPQRYHFTGNQRIPPIIILADDGWYLSKRVSGEAPTREMNKATHGFDPELDSMGATFIAWGKAFQHGKTIEPFENVNLYNLFCATMGLKPSPNDGDEQLIKKVLTQ